MTKKAASLNERTANLSDGSILGFERPGSAKLDEIEQEDQRRRSERNTATNMAPEHFAAVGRAHMEAQAAERKRVRSLPPAERRKARVDSLLGSLSHRLVVSMCATNWTAVETVAEDWLGDLPRDLLEEAAEVILSSHFARADEHQGNSKPTSAR